MLKLCFNATTLRNYDIFEALNFIKIAGYEAVEIALNDTHIHPLKSDPQKIKDVRTYCEDIGLKIGCIAAGGPTLLGPSDYEPSMICNDAKGRLQRIDVYKRSIDLAQDIGCPIVNINSGIQRDGIDACDAEDRFLSGMQELLDYCGKTTLVLEQEPGFFVGTTTKAVIYIKLLNNEKLRFNLDIGHVFCSEPDEECYENIKASMPYVRHIHIEDIKNRIHHHEIPGEGDIDFERILKIINDADYEHYVCVELHHHDQMWERALNESRDYLLNVQEKLSLCE